MWNASNVVSLFTTMSVDVGVILFVVIPAVVVSLVALLGLGFATRKTAEHVFQSKFPRVDWERLDFMRRRGFDPYS